MSSTELTNKIRQIKENEMLMKELETENEALKDSIKAEMTLRNTDEMTVDVFKIRWTSVISNRFDSAAFKATHADLYRQYTKTTESKRFSIA